MEYDKEILDELKQLNAQLKKRVSWKFNLGSGILRGIGYALGAGIIASIIYAIISTVSNTVTQL